MEKIVRAEVSGIYSIDCCYLKLIPKLCGRFIVWLLSTTKIALLASFRFPTFLLNLFWNQAVSFNGIPPSAGDSLCNIIVIVIFAGYSKKSSSSSDVENTGTIPEETGSDDEIELATKAELLDQPPAACEDIAMMDDDEESSRVLRDALNGITMAETNNPPLVSHQEMSTAVGEWWFWPVFFIFFISHIHIAAFVHISVLVVAGCQVQCFHMNRNCGSMSFLARALWFRLTPFADAVHSFDPFLINFFMQLDDLLENQLRHFGTLSFLIPARTTPNIIHTVYLRSRRAKQWHRMETIVRFDLMQTYLTLFFIFVLFLLFLLLLPYVINFLKSFYRSPAPKFRNSVWFWSWRVKKKMCISLFNPTFLSLVSTILYFCKYLCIWMSKWN